MRRVSSPAGFCVSQSSSQGKGNAVIFRELIALEQYLAVNFTDTFSMIF
jgi:hypothetical protein